MFANQFADFRYDEVVNIRSRPLPSSAGLALTVLGAVGSLASTYIPSALSVVDDEKWGYFVGRQVLLPVLLGFFLSGVFVVAGRPRAALWIGAVVAGGVALVDVFAIVAGSV